MSALETVAAGVIAGALMGLASEVACRLGVSKSNLILIDGEFALRMVGLPPGRALNYALGIPIHLVTRTASSFQPGTMVTLYHPNAKLL